MKNLVKRSILIFVSSLTLASEGLEATTCKITHAVSNSLLAQSEINSMPLLEEGKLMNLVNRMSWGESRSVNWDMSQAAFNLVSSGYAVSYQYLSYNPSQCGRQFVPNERLFQLVGQATSSNGFEYFVLGYLSNSNTYNNLVAYPLGQWFELGQFKRETNPKPQKPAAWSLDARFVKMFAILLVRDFKDHAGYESVLPSAGELSAQANLLSQASDDGLTTKNAKGLMGALTQKFEDVTEKYYTAHATAQNSVVAEAWKHFVDSFNELQKHFMGS